MRFLCRIDPEFPELVREAAERRAALKLSRFGDIVRSVDVSITDVNGPRGGVDVRCRVVVRLKRADDVIIQEQAESVKDAIAGAFDRAARAVARASDRHASRYRHATQRSSGRLPTSFESIAR